MISIVNVGPYDDPNPMGLRNYEVRLNCEVIATFQHERADGFVRCLMAAAYAVEDAQFDEAQKEAANANQGQVS